MVNKEQNTSSKISLTDFMKKQSEKKSAQNDSKSSGKKKSKQDEEKAKAEEELEEAKKVSIGKAGMIQDKSDMYKRMFIEAITRYVMAITLIVAVVLAFVHSLPLISAFLRKFISSLFIGDI